MASLLDMVRDVMTPDVVHGIGNAIGEGPGATRVGLRHAVPSVLAGVLMRASTPAGADHLHALITDGGYGGGTLDSVSRMLAGGGATESLVANGGRLLSGLFGAHAESATGSVANVSGMNATATATLLRLVAPMVMAVIGKHIARRGLDGKGLFELLMGERASILAAAPAPLVKRVGLGDPTDVARATSTRVPEGRAVGDPVARPRLLRWWPVLVAGLAGLALLTTLGRAPEQERATTDAPSASVKPSIELTLPDGQRISVDRDGFLHRLNAYLSDPASGTTRGHFVLDPSERTVSALITLLKAYPSARVQLEGQTAEAIKQRLTSEGIAADRVRADGVGENRLDLVVLER